MPLITESYKQLLMNEHCRGPWGVASNAYVSEVANIMLKNKFYEILDYGCGYGNLGICLKSYIPNIIVHHYDPGITKWSSVPEPCDMVSCIDVLEHVEPECINDVLTDLTRVIRNRAFVSIATRPAVRVLENGWNAHILLKSEEEWKTIFEQKFNVVWCRVVKDSNIDMELTSL